jgi:hypothetical protein
MKNLYQISLLAVVLGFSLRAEESQQQESSAKELMVIQPCPDWRVEDTEKTWKIVIPIEGDVDDSCLVHSSGSLAKLSFGNKHVGYTVIALGDSAHVSSFINGQRVCSQEFKIEPPIVKASPSLPQLKKDASDPEKIFLVMTVTKSRGE